MPTGSDHFPIFRQLLGGAHYYRIESQDRFTELQRIGARWVIHEVRAHAYPEKVRVHEMIAGGEGRYVTLSPVEWEAALRSMRERDAWGGPL